VTVENVPHRNALAVLNCQGVFRRAALDRRLTQRWSLPVLRRRGAKLQRDAGHKLDTSSREKKILDVLIWWGNLCEDVASG
jgi:hypothetical protein